MSFTRLRLAVLGGSSPFIASLFDALAEAGEDLEPGTLVLHGRRLDVLAAVGRYARRRLGPQGWQVDWTGDLASAAEGASVVLHQIRYGGLDARRDDEQLAEELGCPADETLGPGGLLAAIRMAPALRLTAAELQRASPDAVVLNLTNPLSCSTALLASAGVRRVVGLCELPHTTLSLACQLLRVSEREVSWAYAGLNHRGFIYLLDHGHRNLLTELPERLGRATLGGIGADTIRDLGALPLKYFALFGRAAPRPPRRAEFLRLLRERILQELEEDPDRTPPSLGLRSLDWYRQSVVPVLCALHADAAEPAVVNLPAADGIVRELRATVSRGGIVPETAPPTPAAVAAWLARFEAHERRVVAAAAEPTRRTVAAAVEADPLVPAQLRRRAVQSILSRRARQREQSAATRSR
jgi:6-phospho-beta-glucosidase